ncbi:PLASMODESMATA CALLOSE-BINDING PROTEIN 3 [Linum perenne]
MRRISRSYNGVPRHLLVLYFTLAASLFSVSSGRRLAGLSVRIGDKIRTTARFDIASLILQRETMANAEEEQSNAAPFSLSPYDTLSPQSSPANCLNPPQQGLPQPQPPPSSSSSSGGSGSDFPTPSGPPGPLAPILPGPATPGIDVPGPPATILSPPNDMFPGPPTTVLSPPSDVFPGPPSDVFPGPPSTFPSPPADVLPGPPSTVPSPSGEVLPGPPSTVPSPSGEILPGPPSTVPSPTEEYPPGPPSYTMPGPNPPQAEAPPALGGPPMPFLPPIVYPPPTGPPRPKTGPPAALWCVAKPSVPDPIMQEAMNYACGSGADCESLQSSGPCFQPDTVYAHASYAFNSYWQRTKGAGGSCSFGGTAILVTVDPSYDGCHFVYY